MMNIKEIISCLKENRQLSGYEISTVSKDSRELFYVLKRLEINRAVRVDSVAISLYVNKDDKTGTTIIKVTPADDRDSLNRKIEAGIVKASASLNKYYPLVETQERIDSRDENEYDLNQIATEVAKAVFAADVYEDGWINSTEIFVSRKENGFINSNGVEHHCSSFKIEVEVIPTYRGEKEEVELYKYYESGSIDYNRITEEINEVLNNAKGRTVATTPKQIGMKDKMRVLVKGEMLQLLLDNFASQLSYSSKYQKENHYEINDTVSDNGIDISMVSEAEGCCNSQKFDSHGVVLKEKKIIENGKATGLWGDIRYGYYLNEKDVTGNLPVIKLEAEGFDYKNEPYLIIENFSSPQLEEASGYWGGEVRFARYYDGEKVVPLTGFSISGNIYEDIKNVKVSEEKDILPDYCGPKYLIFDDITIS